VAYHRRILQSASLDRLEALISERVVAGADREAIDQKIWDLFGEDWCIMFTDLSGFSRGVARFGIIHFLQTIYESQRLLVPIIEDHDGFLLKVEGDSFLVIFRRAQSAIRSAIAMQRKLLEYNEGKAEEDQVLLSAGLGFGRVLRIGDTDVFGAEVNAASKLGEDVAKPWEILVTRAVRDLADDLAEVSYEEIDFVPPGAERAFRLTYQAVNDDPSPADVCSNIL